MRRVVLFVVLLVGCAHARAPQGTSVALRPACADGQRWDGRACVAREGGSELAAGVAAVTAFNVEAALPALERAASHPLDHASNVQLWEQRGIALAYLEREDEAIAAFDMLLALDPDHLLSYHLSPKATFLFEKARAHGAHDAPTLEVHWPRDLRLGAAVPVEVEAVTDPRHLVARTTLYVRPRGESAWRAADVTLGVPGTFRRALLPAVPGTRPTSLQLYAVASDAAGNEVLTWASPTQPREIPLRYDPPTPWYRTWWVWAVAGGVVAAGTGVAVYATQWEPSDEVGGGITVR